MPLAPILTGKRIVVFPDLNHKGIANTSSNLLKLIELLCKLGYHIRTTDKMAKVIYANNVVNNIETVTYKDRSIKKLQQVRDLLSTLELSQYYLKNKLKRIPSRYIIRSLRILYGSTYNLPPTLIFKHPIKYRKPKFKDQVIKKLVNNGISIELTLPSNDQQYADFIKGFENLKDRLAIAQEEHERRINNQRID